jgi:imidazole glycerol-phosphate synthase subunit HisH
VEIAVADVGLGNLRSVERAIARGAEIAGLTARVVLTRDPDRIARSDKVVVPGQGAFRDCAKALSQGMGEAVKVAIRRGTPYFGICLGLQVLFERSAEAEGCAGLALFAGGVERLAAGTDTLTGGALKIPHIGWNRANPGAAASLLGSQPEWFYFVHSYAVRPTDPSIVAATTEYGAPFVSAVAKDNVFACQFHPEKSQSAGLALLARFVSS